MSLDKRVTVYANILGEWIKLEDSDTIFNYPSFSFLYKVNIDDHSFLDVKIKGVQYKLHVSQIQIIC